MTDITIFTVLLFAVALSADAFAVSVCEGTKPGGADTRYALKIAAYFGVFQALMPTLGYFIADVLEKIPFLDRALDWIAFGLLFCVALKMLWDALHEDPAQTKASAVVQKSELVLLAVATSIDAMSAGISFGTTRYVHPFSFITHAFTATAARNTWNSLLSFVVIGITTFLLSVSGVKLGRGIGKKLGRGAQIFGAAILFFLAIKSLAEIFGLHLGF